MRQKRLDGCVYACSTMILSVTLDYGQSSAVEFAQITQRKYIIRRG